jgi:hypothetical protein
MIEEYVPFHPAMIAPGGSTVTPRS